jgi:hypothetical protein
MGVGFRFDLPNRHLDFGYCQFLEFRVGAIHELPLP